TGTKSGRRMGHMPIDGQDGSLAALAGLAVRRVYVHINNTNPILVAGSPERTEVERKGWEIAEDGMEMGLESRCPPASRRTRWSTSALVVITVCTRSMPCSTAAKAARARCRPGRSTATTIRP